MLTSKKNLLIWMVILSWQGMTSAMGHVLAKVSSAMAAGKPSSVTAVAAVTAGVIGKKRELDPAGAEKRARKAAVYKARRDAEKEAMVGALASATIDLDLDSGDELLPIDPVVAADLAAKLKKDKDEKARRATREKARYDARKAAVSSAKKGIFEDPAKAAEIIKEDEEQKARKAAACRVRRAAKKESLTAMLAEPTIDPVVAADLAATLKKQEEKKTKDRARYASNKEVLVAAADAVKNKLSPIDQAKAAELLKKEEARLARKAAACKVRRAAEKEAATAKALAVDDVGFAAPASAIV